MWYDGLCYRIQTVHVGGIKVKIETSVTVASDSADCWDIGLARSIRCVQ